jgi:Uma2 family endonuclease
LRFLFLAFHGFLTPLGGTVHFCGLRFRIRPGKFREPDLLLLRSATDERRENRFWLGADLTLEVVSKDKPERDLIDKRGDYAEGKVPEYWIVNPLNETITVLVLKGKKYAKHGTFIRGQEATSVILPGFSVRVADVFDAD